MGARERTQFELTLKGSEELALRTYRLDAKVRNILFLIQKGYPTIDGILDNSIFPREEVVERLRELLRGHFVAVRESISAAPTTISSPPDSRISGPATESSAPPPPQDSPPTQPPVVYVGF